MVVCADKYHNVYSMRTDYLKDGEKLWERFNRGKEQQKWYYQGILKALAPGSHYCPQLYEQLKLTIDDLFSN